MRRAHPIRNRICLTTIFLSEPQRGAEVFSHKKAHKAHKAEMNKEASPLTGVDLLLCLMCLFEANLFVALLLLRKERHLDEVLSIEIQLRRIFNRGGVEFFVELRNQPDSSRILAVVVPRLNLI